MQGYNFTERVRKVLAMAREESVRLHHEYVGTEHLLLGLIREGEGVAAAVRERLRRPTLGRKRWRAWWAASRGRIIECPALPRRRALLSLLLSLHNKDGATP